MFETRPEPTTSNLNTKIESNLIPTFQLRLFLSIFGLSSGLNVSF